MKLLFDQNLSPKLVNRLADLFPGSIHVLSVGLDCADDDRIWEYATLLAEHDWFMQLVSNGRCISA